MEPPSAEARQLAMVAHLLGLANLAMAFGGLVGVIILYVTSKDDFVRTNARCALNMQITWLLYSIVFSTAYAVVFFSVLHPAFASSPHAHAVGRSTGLGAFALALSIMGMLVLGLIVTAVLNGIGARRAYLGRVFRYAVAIPFLRDPVFAEPTAAA